MKTLKQKFAALALTLLISAASVLSAVPVYAASGSISLVANKATVATGGSLVVAIYMNGGGNAIYGVQADISYPSSKLQYVGFSGSGSAFEIAAANGGSDGLATIARGTINAVSGSGLVGTATFKALAGSGSASIAVAGSSSLSDGNGSPVPYAPGNVSVNFGAVAATPSSSAAPAAAAPEPPKDTAPPAITGLRVKSRTPYSAVITWSTNEPADSAVDYGVDTNYGLSASQGGQATTHEISLASSFLAPKALIHYRVKSADAAGNVQTGSDQTLQLPGVPISVVVRAADGQPQPDALVSLDDQTATTDTSGQATLQSSLGSKQVVISYGGVTVRRPITVARSTKPLPPYKLDLAKQPLNHWMLTSIGLSMVVLTMLVLDAVLFGSTFATRLVRWRHRQAPALQPVSEPRVTHDSGPALFSTLLHHEPTKPVVVPQAPAQVPEPAPVPTPTVNTEPTPTELEIDEAKIEALAIPTALTDVFPPEQRATKIPVTVHDIVVAPVTPAAEVAQRLKPRTTTVAKKPRTPKAHKSKKSATTGV